MTPVPRPRAWHVLIVALIAVFELYVLYLVLTPKVADDYRAYYIDRSASCFPRQITGYYELGQPISFVPGRNGLTRDIVRWCGFQPPGKTGIKSFGDYGIIRLRFDVPDGDLKLTFTSNSNASTSQPEREVNVVVNGTKIGTLTYRDSKRVLGDMVIPEAVAKAGEGGLDIKFEVPRIGPPGTNSEPVTLQLRLEALRVSALDWNSLP